MLGCTLLLAFGASTAVYLEVRFGRPSGALGLLMDSFEFVFIAAIIPLCVTVFLLAVSIARSLMTRRAQGVKAPPARLLAPARSTRWPRTN